MQNGRIVIARIWSRYTGGIPSRAPVIMGLDKNRFKTICIYLMKNSDEPNFFEQEGLQTYYLSGKKFLRIINLPIILKLIGILKDRNVDIIHAHRHQSITYGSIAAFLAGKVKVIAHVHGLNRSANFRRRLVNRIWLKRAAKILTVGQAVKDDVLRYNPAVDSGRVINIGNSIDPAPFTDLSMTHQQAKQRLGLASDSVVFGMVGRLAPTKGLPFLIDAFQTVSKHLPASHLILVGDGRERHQLYAQAQNTHCAGAIHFLGKRQDIPQLLRAMDVFVLPSIAEGIPRAMLEAMASGIPCIGTNVGGIPEVLDQGHFGRLVPPKDCVALADAMIQLAQMPAEQRDNLINTARQLIIRKYAHQRLIDILENLYEAEYNAASARHI
ncbi:MAG: glycosyltransferase [Planctomycetota bacterium]